MREISIYGIYILILGFFLWILNSAIIAPLITVYYVMGKKETPKTVAWYLKKTTDGTLLMVMTFIFSLIFMYWPLIKKSNKQKRKFFNK